MLSKNQKPYDPNELSAQERLRRNIVSLGSSGTLTGKRQAELVQDVHGVDRSVFGDFAFRLDEQRPDHAVQSMRKAFRKGSAWMQDYHADIRTVNPKSGREEISSLAFHNPHEIMAVLADLGTLDLISSKDGLDELSLEHLLHCEAKVGERLTGVAIWGDEVPCNWDRSESATVVSFALPGLQTHPEYKGLRIPIVALPSKVLGAHTMHDIYLVIKWSLDVLASGQWPSARHDGSPWAKGDSQRTKPRFIPKSVLVQVTADWKYMSSTFHFPTHNKNDGMCWVCKCTAAQVSCTTIIGW